MGGSGVSSKVFNRRQNKNIPSNDHNTTQKQVVTRPAAKNIEAITSRRDRKEDKGGGYHTTNTRNSATATPTTDGKRPTDHQPKTKKSKKPTRIIPSQPLKRAHNKS